MNPPFRRLTEADYLATIAALDQHEGSMRGTAAALGIDRKTLRDRLRRAARKGLMGTAPVLPGFVVQSLAVQKDAHGTTQKEWIKQRPIGEEFQLPDGHVIKGVSALTDPDGRIIQQWVKTKFDEAVVDVTKALRESFAEYTGHATLPKAPKSHTDANLLTVYPIADHHLGLYAWAEEAGENYDLAIGAKLLRETMTSLVAAAPAAETAIILNLGDFFHSDDNTQLTPKSKHKLDVDGRHAKILRVGVELLIHCVQLALQRHKKVTVRCLPGNHDPYASLALATALACFFANSKRVTIDTDASAFFWHRFGEVLIGATHGDEARGHDMPGVMASDRAKDWGETRFRYIYLGHVHHKGIGGGEKHGATWETFQTLSPRDNWSHTKGFRSGRSMVAITHHRASGEVMRHTVSVKGPR